MNRDVVIEKLKALEPRLRNLGVGGLYLFGSVARDEAGPASDIDLFIDKSDPSRFGFTEFMASYDILAEIAPRESLSYTTREGLVDFYRADIEATAIKVF
ncbi:MULTISPECIES: nucleotidyltransferase family protein [unclassified Rhizobium]|uniref:nucleotidyltransferase family protein n=1 Tax=unclassified Rhizobium TaxID=2613769 RepID=UPI00160485F2|nr:MULTISPECIES: nucleotidyltransferase domain-containing protein [unclassified Rhizobium]MBB1247501.1 nucleotidyltransferase domain-containing protein [Rhizobium sp. G21]MCV3764240.1 nucleotidyltransferase domain-containing protein [Rhizobium sp. TRM95796]